MSDQSMFSADESAALLREIFPAYPDLRGVRSVPNNLQQWLEDYRKRTFESIDASKPLR